MRPRKIIDKTDEDIATSFYFELRQKVLEVEKEIIQKYGIGNTQLIDYVLPINNMPISAAYRYDNPIIKASLEYIENEFFNSWEHADKTIEIHIAVEKKSFNKYMKTHGGWFVRANLPLNYFIYEPVMLFMIAYAFRKKENKWKGLASGKSAKKVLNAAGVKNDYIIENLKKVVYKNADTNEKSFYVEEFIPSKKINYNYALSGLLTLNLLGLINLPQLEEAFRNYSNL